MIRRIHVKLRLKAQEEHRETAQRVHGFFADRCPVYRPLRDSIAITTELVQKFKDANVHMPATGFVDRAIRLLEKTRFVGKADEDSAS